MRKVVCHQICFESNLGFMVLILTYILICARMKLIQFRQILTQYLLVLKYFELPKGLRGPKDKICHQITFLQCSLVVTLSMAQMQIVKNAECTLPNPDSHFTSFFNISFPDFHMIKIQLFVKQTFCRKPTKISWPCPVLICYQIISIILSGCFY